MRLTISESKDDRRVLTLFDCVCIIAGTIIGAGIFEMPGRVAVNVESFVWLVVIWLFGGLIALLGALCFAELTTTYPDRGGDYGYLKRGYHKRVGFAFSWAAFWVTRPGNIGVMALVFGQFFARLFPLSNGLSEQASLIYAIGIIVVLSATNLLGIVFGKTTQNILTVAKIGGILLIVLAAFGVWGNAQTEMREDKTFAQNQIEVDEELAVNADENTSSTKEPEPDQADFAKTWNSFWLAMVFVMFTFGGWNDIAFVASEVRQPQKSLLRSLVVGVGLVTGVYLLVNVSLVFGLTFQGLSDIGFTDNATSVLVKQRLGDLGSNFFSALVCVSCAGSINAMIFTSPRIYSATAVDYPALRWLTSSESNQGWWRAMLLQSIVTVLLVWTFGSIQIVEGGEKASGIELLVIATTPYFWGFLIMTVTCLFICRVKFAGQFSGYRVPLYPLIPIVFISACIFMTYRSWDYMIQKGLLLQTLLIAGWVGLGIVLSFFMGSKDDGSTNRDEPASN